MKRIFPSGCLAALLLAASGGPLQAAGCAPLEYPSDELADVSVETRITSVRFNDDTDKVEVVFRVDRAGGGGDFPVRGNLRLVLNGADGSYGERCQTLETITADHNQVNFLFSEGEIPEGTYTATLEVGLIGDRNDDPTGNLSTLSAVYGPRLEVVEESWTEDGLEIDLVNSGSLPTGSYTATIMILEDGELQETLTQVIPILAGEENATLMIPADPGQSVQVIIRDSEGENVTSPIQSSGPEVEEDDQIGVEQDYSVLSVSVAPNDAGGFTVRVDVGHVGTATAPATLSITATHEEGGQEQTETETFACDGSAVFEWDVQLPAPFTVETQVGMDSGQDDGDDENDVQVVAVDENGQVSESGASGGGSDEGSGEADNSVTSGTADDVGLTLPQGSIAYGNSLAGEPVPMTFSFGAVLESAGNQSIISVRWSLTDAAIQSLEGMNIHPAEGFDPAQDQVWRRGMDNPTQSWFGDHPAGSWIEGAVSERLVIDLSVEGTIFYDTYDRETGDIVAGEKTFQEDLQLKATSKLPGPDLVVQFKEKRGKKLEDFHPSKRDKNYLRMDTPVVVRVLNQGLARFPQRRLRVHLGWREKEKKGSDEGTFKVFEQTVDGIEPGEFVDFVFDPLQFQCDGKHESNRPRNKRSTLRAGVEVITFDGEISDPETDNENNEKRSPPVNLIQWMTNSACPGGSATDPSQQNEGGHGGDGPGGMF